MFNLTVYMYFLYSCLSMSLCSHSSVLIFPHSAWGASLCRPSQPEPILPNLGPCLEPTTSPPARRTPQTVSGRWDSRERSSQIKLYCGSDTSSIVMNSDWTCFIWELKRRDLVHSVDTDLYVNHTCACLYAENWNYQWCSITEHLLLRMQISSTALIC